MTLAFPKLKAQCEYQREKGIIPLAVFKFLVDSRHYQTGELERRKEPEKSQSDRSLKRQKPDEVVKDLNPTEYGEASEKAHRAPYKPQLSLHCHL